MERKAKLAARAPRAFGFAVALVALTGCDSGDDDPNGMGNELDNGGKGGSTSAAGSTATAAGRGGAGSSAAGSNAAGSSAAGSSAAGAGGSAAGGGDLSKLKGGFLVKLTAAMAETPLGPASPALATMIGKVSDGDQPELLVWTRTASEGDCELFEPSVPQCDPACGGLAACVEGDVCKDYPKAQTVGNVLVSGVGEAEFEMEPISGNYQPPNDVKLPYPPCDAGDTVRVMAEGGGYAPFTLEAKCIDVLDFPGPLAIEEDQPLALSWSAPTMTGLSRIHVKMDISHHGGSKGKIECDVEDNGSYEIAASLVSKLVDLGVAGFPTVSITRTAVGGSTAAQPEHVELTVSQAAEQLLDIPGLTSCTSDDHCADGQTCRSDKTCG